MSMKTSALSRLLKALLFLSAIVSGSVSAEQVATFVEVSAPKAARPKYLSSLPYKDNGYLYISAVMDNAGNKPCIAPASGTFFSENSLDVVVTAQMFGFYGVDSSNEVPVATYSYSSKEKSFCQSAWRMPVLLVPPTPMGVKPAFALGLAAENEPTIVVRLRVKSDSQEKLTSYAQSLLAIAAGVTTGGAAITVVGLTNVAGGPALKYLSDEMNKLTKNRADATFPLVFPNAEIASGLTTKRLTLVQTDRYLLEDSEKVITEMRSGKRSSMPVLQISFNVMTRRTMFDEDANLSFPDQLPSSLAKLQKFEILNFPKGPEAGFMQGYPTIYQRINSDASSLVRRLSNHDTGACDPLFVNVRDFGFNNVDRAIVVGAILDDAYPDWRKDAAFYGACLQSEPDIKKYLEKIYTSRPFAAETPVDPASREIATNTPYPWWSSNIEQFMVTLKEALYSKPPSRLLPLRGLIGSAQLSVSDSLSATREGQDPGTAPDGIQQLSGATITTAGCIFGFKSGAKNYAGLVFVALNTSGKLSPYLLMADVNSDPGGAVSLKAAWIKDLSTKPGSDYVATIGQAKFPDASMCGGVDAKNKSRSIDTVMAELTK